MIKKYKSALLLAFLLGFARIANASGPSCFKQFSPQTANFDTQNSEPVTVVIDVDEVPKEMTPETLNTLFGAKVIAAPLRTPPSPQKIDGTVFHLGDADYLRDRAVGKNNPTLARRGLYRKFDNKIFEYLWSTQIDPNIMPKSVVLIDYIHEMRDTSSGRELLEQVIEIRNQMLKDRNFQINSHEKIVLISFVEKIIELVHNDFPSGAIIKMSDEFKSGDTGSVLKSEKIDTQELVNSFAKSFLKMRATILSKTKRTLLNETDFATDESAIKYDKNWSFVKSLIFGEFDRIMAQKRETIVREGRMSMVAGKVYNIVDRFYGPWGPRSLFLEAALVLNNFIKKAKRAGFDMDKMSGGVDFGLLENGRIVILDFNFGAMDGFLDGINSPVTANMFISSFTGRKTPLLNELSQAQNLNLDGKWQLILKLSRKYLSHLTPEDRSSVRGDMVRWLGMNKHLTENEEEILFQKTR